MEIIFNDIQFSLAKVSAYQIIPENILLQGVSINNPHLVQVEISPTDSCNQNCKWCFTVQDRMAGRSITSIELRKYIEKFVHSGGISIVFSGGGEPLTYKGIYKKTKDFDDKNLIQYCLDLGLNCGLITNGVNEVAIQNSIDIKKLTFLRISVDSLNKKVYSELHDCSSKHFDKLISNIDYISDEKGRHLLPAFGISFVVGGNSGLNCSVAEIDRIRKFVLERNIDFVQFKHLHTSGQLQAEIHMQMLHENIMKMDWKDTEFWVQKYLAPEPATTCRVTEIIQSVGGNNQRFPCCHLFGDSSHFPQENFLPQGKTVYNCSSRVCRYVSVNDLINDIKDKNKYFNAEKKLELSLKKYGFHPYRLFPTAPDLYFPVSSKSSFKY